MVRRLLLSLPMLAALAACATAPLPARTSPTGSAPAPIPGYDWILYEDGDDARLSFGVAESDDVRVAFDCRRATGRLGVTALAPPGAGPTLLLESGGDTLRLEAASEEDLVHDGLILSAGADAGAPVFQRFRRIGWLATWRDGEREAYAAHPGSAGRIERFFAFCG